MVKSKECEQKFEAHEKLAEVCLPCFDILEKKMKNKTIHVKKDIWLVLNQIKLDKGYSTINDVIQLLIDNYKKIITNIKTEVKIGNTSDCNYFHKDLVHNLLFDLIDDMSNVNRYENNYDKIDPVKLKKRIKELLQEC